MKGRALDEAALVSADGDSVAAAFGDPDNGHEACDGNRTATLVDDISFGHRFALDPPPAGETVRKYGEVTGRTTTAAAAGEWVHTYNCESTRGRGDVAAEVER